ncbi:carboxypeptidase-like regulatory domain-containing protein [Roseivirga sp.]|uniref:carboxypeptidase-like regulatory domain-containing protein n=1 Tax=Roseivirga sp. TaxID=1964215 RepID=UPI003B8DA8E2
MVRKFLISILIFSSIKAYAQEAEESNLDSRITVQFNGVSIPNALRQIDKLSGVKFSYNSNIISREPKFDRSYRNESLRVIIEDLLSMANLYYREVAGTVIILKNIYSERKISGRVIDKDSEAPLAYASVFIERSTLGVATDLKGEFEIENIPDIGFNLVISYVGYKPKSIPFNYKQELDNVNFVIKLEVDPVALESIYVVSKSRKRKSYEARNLFRRFKTEFLGQSDNAKKCKIVNPEVLNFEVLDSLGNYRVTADDILFIENNALGYRVGYILEEFKYENGLKSSIGSAKFEEMRARSRKRYNRWENAREKAYNGSVRHFLNAMLNGTTDEEGFSLNLIQYDSVTAEYTTPLNPPPIEEIIEVRKTDTDYLFTLHAESDLEITYRGEYEDSGYKKLYRSTSRSGNIKYTDRKVRSSISLTDSLSLSSYQTIGLDANEVEIFQKSIIFFENRDTPIVFPGQFTNPRDVLFSGWWRWGAFSDFLPLNYRPD